MDRKLISSSKFLSLILRHKPETIGLKLDENGWVGIEELIFASRENGKKLDLDLLLRIVHENEKQRFLLSEDGKRIRANQGHSVPVDLGLEPRMPPKSLFHGTVDRFLENIHEKGLIKGTRQHVHLSSDLLTATTVGKRRGEPVVLLIHAQKMVDNRYDLFLSQNGVWLTDHVPPSFIDFPD
jgi:putative RNA 2'-phosphotransferase